MQGINTNDFGIWLSGHIRSKYPDYHVYYDHGDSRLENVVAIKGFLGENVNNLNRITDVDIAIIDSNQEIVLLIEIEEKAGSPKKYIGSIFATLMSNKLAIGTGKQQRYLQITDKSKFIIAGILPTQRRIKKMQTVLLPRIQQIDSFPDGIKASNIELIFETTMSSVVGQLKNTIEHILGCIA